MHDASCRARRSTTRSATSGTTARSGTATTPRPPSAAWPRPACCRSPSGRRRARRADRHGPPPRQGLRSTRARRSTHEDLEAAAAKAQGVDDRAARHPLHPHGLVVKYFYELGDEEFYDGFVEPGLTYSARAGASGSRSMEIPNLVTDTIANEVTVRPGVGVALPLHNALMRNLGVTLTEIAWLDDLADDCAEDGRWTLPLRRGAAQGRRGHRRAGEPHRRQVAADGRLRRTARGCALYGDGQPADIEPEFADALAMFRRRVGAQPRRRRRPLLRRRASPAASSTELTDAFAAALLDGGFAARRPAGGLPAERAAVRRSALVGTWKAGGIVVSINPMNRRAGARRYLLERLGRQGAGLRCEALYRDVAASVVARHGRRAP